LDIEESTSGYVFKLVGGAISWSRSKHIVIASSMMYVEFVACYEAVGAGTIAKEICASSMGGRQQRKTTKEIL
jgi:hypothetical protein